MKITIVGAGYVGLSLSVLLAQKNNVTCYDIDEKKINLLKNKISPISDEHIENFLKNKNLNLTVSTNKEESFNGANFVIIATPTNYDDLTESFNTTSVDTVVKDVLDLNPNSTIVIRSTIPFGHTDKIKLKYNASNIFFSPEFLREGMALYDNLYPSRIIVGDTTANAKLFSKLLLDCSKKKLSDTKISFMSSKEAESIKLFSNSYLAMRIAYFNELDTFAETHNLSSENIIDGVSDDPRIGNYYNNPSFGYGGYCLPKDTKQLLNSYGDTPNNLIKAIIESNKTRKNFIVQSILDKKPERIGVYRLQMKSGSDNFRHSAILEIIKLLKGHKIKIKLYEPLIKENFIEGIEIVKDLKKFISESDLIIANRTSNDLNDVDKNKLYSRDIFKEN